MAHRNSWQYDLVYNTRRWRKLRARLLAKYPLCIECRRLGYTAAATVADHIQPLSECRDQPWLWFDFENLQPMCKVHHDQRTADMNRKELPPQLKAWRDLVDSPIE